MPAALSLAAAPSPATAQQLGDSLARTLVTVQRRPEDGIVRAAPSDSAWARRLVPIVASARQRIESFFGERFADPVAVTLVPDRAAFSDVLRRTWKVPDTQCWMVAAGVADFVIAISPRAWATDACEHAADSAHVREIFTHELVHAFHGQRHPSRDFDFEGADDIGWLVEGIAVYASGQLDSTRLADAVRTVRDGGGPARLADGWSGRSRYGVAGSMLRFVDERWGRPMLVRLLPLSTNAAIVAALGTNEAAFLRDWRAWLLRL